MLPPIHIDNLEAVRAAIVYNVNALLFGHVEDFETVSGRP
jgi:hypothetical protein